MLDRIRNRISLEEIEVCIEDNQLIFNCNLTDEKQLNIAAGKIHRSVSNGVGKWSLNQSDLTLKLPANKTAFKLGEIHEAFKRMVT